MIRIVWSILLLSLGCQISFASNGLFFNIIPTDTSLSITTTIPNHAYSKAGIKINSPGYTLTNPGIDCSLISNGYCLFSVSDTKSRLISISGNPGSVNLSLCLNGAGPVSCQNYDVSVASASRLKYAYVSNDNNTVLLCPINLNGTLGDCINAGNSGVPFDGPNLIALNAAGTLAYITTYPGNQVLICPINSDKTFGACIDSGNTGEATPAPFGIILNQLGTKAYVVSSSTNSVLICPINASGTFGACINADATGVPGFLFDLPASIALNKAETKAYITNLDTDVVSICTLNTAGLFSGCVDSSGPGVGFNRPSGIALNNTQTSAYITNLGNQTITLCSINSDGSFGICIDSGNTGEAFDRPASIALNAESTRAYITNNGNSTVLLCPINANGTFGACINSGNTGLAFNGPEGVALIN